LQNIRSLQEKGNDKKMEKSGGIKNRRYHLKFEIFLVAFLCRRSAANLSVTDARQPLLAELCNSRCATTLSYEGHTATAYARAKAT
jgi:hypothetical protein